ncbi:MAG: FtsX-like permease family protein, partial [Terriglobales bacterium]
LGRTLVAGDETDSARPMVITDQLWRSAFGADPQILGRRIGAPGAMATVVGVLPASFKLSGRALGPILAGEPTQYFDALHFHPGPYQVFSDFNYTVLGRLRPGVTLDQARSQLDVIAANLARTAPDGLGLASLLTTVQAYTVAEARQQLWLLLAGVGAVLLIVCVNLGGLWVTRVADRRRDWAIRAALGAAPGRLARQVLGESLTLALLGGVLGIACAALGMRALLALAPADIPRLDQVHLDWRVIVFGLGLSVIAGLLTGLVPALRLGRSDPQAFLKANAGSTTADRSSLRSRQSLIALQAALSTLLLAAAGLIGLSFYRLVSQNTGFASQQAWAADVAINIYNDDQRDHILSQLPAAAAALPGVSAAAVTSHLPLMGETWVDGIGVPGRAVTAAKSLSTNVRFISPGYFHAMGVSLLAGRDLEASDRPKGWPPKSEKEEAAMPGAVVVSAAAVRALWPGMPLGEAVGRKILFNGGTTPAIVGVVADVRTSFTAAPPSVVYQPFWTQPPYHFALVVRSSLPAASLAAPLRQAIWQLAPAAPVPLLRPLASLQSDAVAPQRYQLTLLLLFAGLALLLAAMGVYALVGHSVARRRKEFAIRLTLGAGGGSIWSMIVRQALAPVAGGVVAGLVLAFASGRLLASFLFEVSPASPAVLAAVALAVLAAALLACLAPARNATHTDPVGSLRAE